MLTISEIKSLENAIDNQCNAELTEAIATLINTESLTNISGQCLDKYHGQYEINIEVRAFGSYGTIPNFHLEIVFDSEAYIKDRFTIRDKYSNAINIDRVHIAYLGANDKYNTAVMDCLSRLISNEGLNIIAANCYNYITRKKATGQME